MTRKFNSKLKKNFMKIQVWEDWNELKESIYNYLKQMRVVNENNKKNMEESQNQNRTLDLGRERRGYLVYLNRKVVTMQFLKKLWRKIIVELELWWMGEDV